MKLRKNFLFFLGIFILFVMFSIPSFATTDEIDQKFINLSFPLLPDNLKDTYNSYTNKFFIKYENNDFYIHMIVLSNSENIYRKGNKFYTDSSYATLLPALYSQVLYSPTDSNYVFYSEYSLESNYLNSIDVNVWAVDSTCDVIGVDGEVVFQGPPLTLDKVVVEAQQKAKAVTKATIQEELAHLVPVGVTILATMIVVSLIAYFRFWRT